MATASFGCEYDAAAVDYLLERHYRGSNRPLRRCHPRDLLLQLRCVCSYNNVPLALTPEGDRYHIVAGTRRFRAIQALLKANARVVSVPACRWFCSVALRERSSACSYLKENDDA